MCIRDSPNLKELDLSHNALFYFPCIPKLSCSLAILNLSDNCLSTLPMNITAPALTTLNISRNCLSYVPLCICTFTSLMTLNLSDNDIRALPYEMGLLTDLVHLDLNGLKKLKEPPKYVQKTSQDCIHYLRDKLSDYVNGSYCMPVSYTHLTLPTIYSV